MGYTLKINKLSIYWSGCEQDTRVSVIRFSAGVRDSCLYPKAFRWSLGPTHPPIYFVPEALSAGIKGLGYEAQHSIPNGAEFKNEWNYTSTPNMLHGMHRDILPLPLQEPKLCTPWSNTQNYKWGFQVYKAYFNTEIMKCKFEVCQFRLRQNPKHMCSKWKVNLRTYAVY
jgi:hypothetical protein